MQIKNISVIVPGGLNTDIIGLGVNKLLAPGELTLSGELRIGPGGKARNIAQMIACLSGKNKVAMIGRSSKDPFNLWQIPINALRKAGVNTDYVKILDFKKAKKFPGVALIPVEKSGSNQIYVLPGVNGDFSKSDIDNALPLFKSAQKNTGILALALELPLQTAIYAVKKANEYGLKVILDPGGIDENTDYSELLRQDIFLIKPNEHEAKMLTGVEVKDMATAKKSADKFMSKGIKNIFITAGKNGAYLFNEKTSMHIPVPGIKETGVRDETGCGDQTMATICSLLPDEDDIVEVAKAAILSGTLQFCKAGICPVTREELKTRNK